MTEKDFLNSICNNGGEDVLQIFLDSLKSAGSDYCVIGGLAVNAYVEPLVSLELNVVVATKDIDRVCEAAEKHFKIEGFAHSINLSTEKSAIRIQLQTDPRYQDFINRAIIQNVLGYEMKVASVEDVLQGKIWAYLDEERRISKRQKDLADIARLVETLPSLINQLPEKIRNRVE